ncbi:NifU family protein [Streptomyces thermocarboxydovorans]|uniref:NifU family protein n=1 Tax=Streptomyces thermocarboxydovorans TaxID=59298 RepID=A0ABP3SIB1_9ACTN
MSGAQGAADRGTVSAEAAGRMVEEVLDLLAASGDRTACEAAEELVRVLMQFYGAGLARIVELLGRHPGAPGEQALTALLDDDLVASLLVLHDLHPADVETRIARALDAVPYPVENAGFDADSGTLRLRLTGSAGCGSTREAVEQAARDALAGLAPEVTEVRLDADAAREPVLLQIGSGPPAAQSTNGRPPAGRAS